MNFWEWIKSKFASKPIPLTGDFDAQGYIEAYGDVYIREMAFWSAVNFIAKAISKCEFKTFENWREVKKREFYLWNIEPNINQNSSEFIQKWISQLCMKNECLIVEQNRQLLIADDFDRTEYALYEDVFKNVSVGDFTFDRSFLQSEVLYFKLNNTDMRKVIEGLYGSYSRLIAYSMKAYQRSRGTKGIFSYDTLPPAGTEQRDMFDKIVNERMGVWLNSDNAALPLGKGQSFEELKDKTYSTESTRDIRAQIDDIFDFTAKAMGIPPALLRGDVQGTSDSVDNALTFCIDPLVDMMAAEINRKRNGYESYLSGTYLTIDTKTIKHVDLLSVSTAIDKLISSGAFSVNDIRELVGEPRIDEPWADEHFITKNYSSVHALEGGEKD